MFTIWSHLVSPWSTTRSKHGEVVGLQGIFIHVFVKQVELLIDPLLLLFFKGLFNDLCATIMDATLAVVRLRWLLWSRVHVLRIISGRPLLVKCAATGSGSALGDTAGSHWLGTAHVQDILVVLVANDASSMFKQVVGFKACFLVFSQLFFNSTG